jgi:transposase-like protein
MARLICKLFRHRWALETRRVRPAFRCTRCDRHRLYVDGLPS